jgi:hypothetical protein
MSKQLFYQGQPGATSGVLVASSSATRTIDAATICNPSAGAETFTLYLVQDGDSAADDVILYHEKSVASGILLRVSRLVAADDAAGRRKAAADQRGRAERDAH